MSPRKVTSFFSASLALASVVILVYCPVAEMQDLILQKCLPKADNLNITIKCNDDEKIAIKAAFFTSSVVDQCPFAYVNRSKGGPLSNEIEDKRSKHRLSCTDDLRMTLNSKCSGQSSCSVNLRKAHTDRCPGIDGWINIKYTCVNANKLHQYCNLDLTGNFGYVTNPGYPKFYPPYICKWKVKAFPGQRIQIDVLDLAIREPRKTNKKILGYDCIDSLSIIEDNAKVVTLCGDVKGNLIEYRSKSDQLTIEFKTLNFSPTRGVLFKYSLVNCPTLKSPSNGFMIRNGSFAQYWCQMDHVFENSGKAELMLYCEHDTYWNGSVPRCIPKENVTVMAYALTHHGEQQSDSVAIDSLESHSAQPLKKYFNKGYFTPVVLLVIVILTNVVIIAVVIALKRKTSCRTAV